MPARFPTISSDQQNMGDVPAWLAAGISAIKAMPRPSRALRLSPKRSCRRASAWPFSRTAALMFVTEHRGGNHAPTGVGSAIVSCSATLPGASPYQQRTIKREPGVRVSCDLRALLRTGGVYATRRLQRPAAAATDPTATTYEQILLRRGDASRAVFFFRA